MGKLGKKRKKKKEEKRDLDFVCKSMGSSLTGSSPMPPIDSFNILRQKLHNTYFIDLETFVFEREQNYLQNGTKPSTVGNIEKAGFMLQLSQMDTTHLWLVSRSIWVDASLKVVGTVG